MVDDARLEEQKNYYRQRAPEYDDWWYRRGRYDLGQEHLRSWDADKAALRRRLEATILPTASLLELAAGTGTWTETLLAGADEVTAVDASSEVLDINRAKCEATGRADAVTHIEADIFDLDLGRRFAVVFFSFWLTHVPDERFREFWATVERHLEPGGRVFVIDNAHPESVGSWSSADEIHVVSAGTSSNDVAGGTATRTLSDGRTFDIVKRYWHPTELDRALYDLGWRSEVETTDRFFLHALVERQAD